MPEPAGPIVVPGARESLAPRVLHMLLYAVAFWVVCWAVGLTAIVQLALRVFAAAPSPELQRFGTSLASYARQVVSYLTFASDTLPFPLGPFPPGEQAEAVDEGVNRAAR